MRSPPTHLHGPTNLALRLFRLAPLTVGAQQGAAHPQQGTLYIILYQIICVVTRCCRTAAPSLSPCRPPAPRCHSAPSETPGSTPGPYRAGFQPNSPPSAPNRSPHAAPGPKTPIFFLIFPDCGTESPAGEGGGAARARP